MRVTAMMMKMIKGQVIRVSDHSCQREQESMLRNSNTTEFLENKEELFFRVTHWLSDDGQPVLPKKKT